MLHHSNAYWKTIYILFARSIQYAIDFSNSGLKKRHRKFRRAIQFFQAAILQPTVICLIKRAGDNLINFSNSCQEKGLVSSSYSSAAAEFLTAIKDRLREQHGATQIPGSSRVTYGYRANTGIVIQYQVLIIHALDFSTNGMLLGYFVFCNLLRKCFLTRVVQRLGRVGIRRFRPRRGHQKRPFWGLLLLMTH